MSERPEINNYQPLSFRITYDNGHIHVFESPISEENIDIIVYNGLGEQMEQISGYVLQLSNFLSVLGITNKGSIQETLVERFKTQAEIEKFLEEQEP